MIRPALRRPEALLAGTFATLIVAGTILLRLPVAHRGEPVGLLDAFFTATSAVCVTGLITVDTATAYSRWGQTVILVLIQLGGLGIMSFGALAAQLLHLRFSFTSQVAWRSAFFEAQAQGDLRRVLRWVLLMTVLLEVLGTALLYAGLHAGSSATGDLFDAAFLSVSAFCNAGFSVYSDSAEGLGGSPLIVVTLLVLIVAGGLGYTVLFEAFGRLRCRLGRRRPDSVHWSLQSRIVLRTTLLLIAGGAVVLFMFGFDDPDTSLGGRAVDALFHSVTARTAGFSTVDVGRLPLPALLVLIALMFIGGSPGSCAGGVKTTTAAVWLARVRARLKGLGNVSLLGRRLPQDVVRRAALVLSLAVLWNLVGIMLLTVVEGTRTGVRFEHLIFEQVSAFATVGLSAGVTSSLAPLSKLWIVATMFVGRLGPLTIALAILARPRTMYDYPTERVMVG